MTHMKTHSTSSKVLLLTDDHSVRAGAQNVQIKRFRIARVRPENRPALNEPRLTD